MLQILLFFLMIRRPPRSTLFPYRRSSDLGQEQSHAHHRHQYVDVVQPRGGGVLPGGLQEGRGVQGLRQQPAAARSEEHTSELQSQFHLVCRLLLEKKKKIPYKPTPAFSKT